MFSYCLLCFKKGFAESRASNERHRMTFQGEGLTFWSVCLPVVHPLSVAVVVVFNVCFVLISFKFKTLSDLFVEDSRGVVVPFDAFSPFGILCFFLFTFIVCVWMCLVYVCVCVNFTFWMLRRRTVHLFSEFVYVSFVCLLACFTILVCMCVTYFLDAHILQYILVNLTFLLLLNYSCLGSLHI